MNRIPKTTVDALATTSTALLVPLGFPPEKVEAAVKNLIDSVCGNTERINEPIDRVLTLKETAGLLHRSTKTVTDLCHAGKLKAVYCGAKGKRASGISEKSVRIFIEGRAA